MSLTPAIWFPAIRAGSGADVFTECLCAELNKRGIRAEITWLPHRAEYAPWAVAKQKPPAWVNVMHVNTWLPSSLIPAGLPIIATVHHAVHHPAAQNYKGLLRTIYHKAWIAPNERRIMRIAAATTAVSEFAAQTAKEILLNVPMRVIYNGVDTETFHPIEPTKKPGKLFRLLYVGAWRKQKGVDLLEPIMRELGDGYELHYTGGAGAAQDRKNIPANMYDLGRLHGKQAVASAMQSADAFIFPSRSEGFGLVAAEAMACGLPVIACKGTALEEIVEHEKTGFLCPSDDIKCFSKAITRLRNDTDLNQKLARAARHIAVTRFSIKTMVDDYVAEYKNLCAS
jgi:glycosyltransferase involved in cell wall biosynthesis